MWYAAVTKGEGLWIRKNDTHETDINNNNQGSSVKEGLWAAHNHDIAAHWHFASRMKS